MKSLCTFTSRFKTVFLSCAVLLSNYLFGDVHPGSYELCKQELDAVPIKNFSTNNMLWNFKQLGVSLIQIQDNKLFINNRLIDDQCISEISAPSSAGNCYLELLLTMHKLTHSRKLPNVTFLYTKHCYDLDANKLAQVKIPVLVGVNSPIYENRGLITFISSCPFARHYLGKANSNWSLENALSKTIDSHGKVPWEEKSSKIFWRGCLSDVIGWEIALNRRKCLCDLYSPPTYLTPREYISALSLFLPELIDAGITSAPWGARVLKPGDFKPNSSILDHVQYKYQIVLDGIHCTVPGYTWRLLSDCCVLKVESILYNFFYVNLIPWVHYVPISEDLHDLIEIQSFLEDHQNLAQEIANNGKDFALNYLQSDDYLDFCVMVLELYAEKQITADQLLGASK